MKKLIVVTEKKTEGYANYLRGLVSQNDDTEEKIIGTKDGEVEIAIYNEKQFQDRKLDMSSNQRLLFVGNSSFMKKEREHFDKKFNKYGMVFGSLGKQACLYVDYVVPMNEYDEFIKYAQGIQEDVRKVTFNAGDVAQVAAGAAVGAGVELGTAVLGAATILATGALMPVIAIGGAAVIAGGGLGTIKYNAKKKEIERQQYDCLILKCYLDYLNDFMK